MFEYARPLHDLIEELRRRPSASGPRRPSASPFTSSLPTEDTDRLAEAIREAKRQIFDRARCTTSPMSTPPDLLRRPPVRRVPGVSSKSRSTSPRSSGPARTTAAITSSSAPCRRSRAAGPTSSGWGKLTKRIEEGAFKEIIIATNPTVEGEATALYPPPRAQGVRRPHHPSGHGPAGGLGPRFRRPGDHQKGPGGRGRELKE